MEHKGQYEYASPRAIFAVFAAALIFLASVPVSEAQSVDPEATDKRCKCICPRDKNKTNRAIYIENVTPEFCNCDHVVLPKLPEEGKIASAEFCARCQCKHESRNSWTIKIVVIAFIVITGLLMVYMAYLVIETRFFKGTKAMSEEATVPYEEHLDEEEYTRDRNGVQTRERSPTLRVRFSEQMARWKRAVMQQRGNVYIRRTVLNN